MRKESITKKNTSPAIVCCAPWRLTAVTPKDHYCLQVVFVDGTQGIVNLKSLIFSQHAGVFSQLKDLTTFNQVHLSYGAATWPGELDLAPDVMHDHIQIHGCWTPSAD